MLFAEIESSGTNQVGTEFESRGIFQANRSKREHYPLPRRCRIRRHHSYNTASGAADRNFDTIASLPFYTSMADSDAHSPSAAEFASLVSLKAREPT